MRKIWLVAKTTYRKRVRSGTFLLLTFGLPLIMVVAGGVSVISQIGGIVPDLGYVDRTGEMALVNQISYDGETVSVVAYPDLRAAEEGFHQGEVAGYIFVPEDYFVGGSVRYYAEEEPNAKLTSALEKLIRTGLLADAPDWMVDRLEEPADFTYLALESGVSVSEGPPVIIRVGTPIFLAFVFVFAVFTGANQMGTAVVLEKDQRAMEMVITSISPLELVMGKILGLTLLSMTQITAWVLSAVLAVALFFWEDLAGQAISLPWRGLVWAGLLCIPGYFLFATAGAGLGIIAGDKEQARQLSGMLGFIGMGPMYFMGILVDAIDGPLAVGLTLFPFTAPTIGLFRMSLTEVPVWQLAASFGILVSTLAVSVWLVARIFRATMLLYGQKLKPAQVWQAVRESGVSR